MRVTKLIREYVAKKVHESYPKSAEELAWEERSRTLNQAMTEANEIVEAFAEKVIAELNEKYGFAEGYDRLEKTQYSIVRSRGQFDDPIYKTSYEARKNREKAIEAKIEEILLTLELGGSKADLDEMLANIGK
jgi:hypothetical protein